MCRAHFPLVHRRTRTAFSRRSVAVAAVLARELAISLVFRVLAPELLEARKRFGLELLLLDAFLVKGIVPGKTAVRISVSGLRGICASVEGASTRSRASRIARARADVASVVFGIAQALRRADGIVGVSARAGSRICLRALAGGIPRSGRARIARCVSRGIE